MTVRELLIRLGFEFNAAQAQQIEAKINGIKSTSVAAASAVNSVGSKMASSMGPGISALGGGLTAFRNNVAASMAASSGHINALKGHVSGLKSNLVGLAGAAAGGFGLFALADAAITAGDNSYRMATKLRLSTTEAAGLSKIFSLAGVDANNFATTITRLDRQLETAGEKGNLMSNTLAEFGVNLKGADGQLLPVNKQLEELARGFQKAEDAGQSDEFVTNVLGPRGMELIPVLREYQDLVEDSKKIKGIGMDPQMAHNTARSMRILKGNTKQLGMVMASAFLPLANRILPGLISLFQGLASFAAKYKILAQSIAAVAGAFIAAFAAAKAFFLVKEMLGTIWSVVGLLKANPVFALMAAAAIVLALVLEDIYTWIQGGDSLLGDWLGSWDEFKAKASTYMQPLIDGFNRLWQAIQSYVIPAIMQISDSGVEAFNGLVGVIGPVIMWIIDQFAELTNNGQLYLDLLLTFWNGFVTAIVLLLQLIYQVFTGQWGAAVDTVIQYLQNLLNTALSILSQIGTAIGQYVLSKLGVAGQMLAKLTGINLNGVVTTQEAAGAGRGIAGAGGLKNEINVNVTAPEGTTAAQAEYLQQSAEQSYGGVYNALESAGGPI